MMEQRLRRIEENAKALKANAPISGSLVDTFFIQKTATKELPDGASFTCTVKFIPDTDKTGITELSYYRRDWSDSPYWSQYNPLGEFVNTGHYTNSAGELVATTSGSFATSDGSTWKVSITAVAYGTVEGHIEIEFS